MCTHCQLPQFDESTAEAFGEKMLQILNHGALSLMVSIGHRTGLFDTMALLPPANIEDIASAADLNQRYVQEWIGAMTTGGIVICDTDTRLYHLPAEHAVCLTRNSAPDNMAAFAQYMSVLGSVEDGIVECFEKGGGVPYSEFPRFQTVMEEDSGQSVLPALIEHIIPLAPELVKQLDAGIKVLDVGCGKGRALNLMAQAFPNSEFVGYEISEEGILAGQAEADANGLTNVNFALQDAASFDESEAFDLVFTFDAVHDQAKPDALLKNIHRALKPGGTYLMQDIKASSEIGENLEHPMGPLLYTISTMHCMTVSLAEGGKGLGAMWGKEIALEMLGEAGFEKIRVEELEHDLQNYYYVIEK